MPEERELYVVVPLRKEGRRVMLKPCPFCDCEDTTAERVCSCGGPPTYQARCPSCHACGPDSPSEEIAITYWNAILGRSISVIGDSGTGNKEN